MIVRSLGPARVVAIGASADGFEALERLLARLQPRFGLAIVVMQHRTMGDPRNLLDIFHFSRLPAAVLVLGTADTPAPRSEAFEGHEPAHRNFTRSASTTRHDSIRNLMTRRVGSERPVVFAAPRGSMKITYLRVIPTRDRLDHECELLVTFTDDSSERRAEESWRGAKRACELLPAWMSDVLPAADADHALLSACRALVSAGDYRGAWATRCGAASKRHPERVPRTGTWKGCAPDVAPPGMRAGVAGLATRVMKAGHALVLRDAQRAEGRARSGARPASGSTAVLALRNGECLIGPLPIRAAGADSFGITELRLLAPLVESLGRRLGELEWQAAARD